MQCKIIDQSKMEEREELLQDFEFAFEEDRLCRL